MGEMCVVWGIHGLGCGPYLMQTTTTAGPFFAVNRTLCSNFSPSYCLFVSLPVQSFENAVVAVVTSVVVRDAVVVVVTVIHPLVKRFLLSRKKRKLFLFLRQLNHSRPLHTLFVGMREQTIVQRFLIVRMEFWFETPNHTIFLFLVFKIIYTRGKD